MNYFILPLALLSAFVIGIMLIHDATEDLYLKGESDTGAAAEIGHEANHTAHRLHSHPPLEVSSWVAKPSVSISAFEDTTTRGWTFKIDTSNFAFTPENVNQDNQPNQGHAHLFVDGVKAARVYSRWVYLDQLAPGERSISVTLNSNQHEELFYGDQQIKSEISIVQR